MLLKIIPRGRAKSPSAVLPPHDLKKEFLEEQLMEARSNVLEFHRLPENAFFSHPFFNHLRRNEAKKFLEIHTEHHLKIIREIRT